MTNTPAISDVADTRRCPRCGALNNCAIAQGEQQCWCMIEPVGMALPSSNTSCYCRDCLHALAFNAAATAPNSPTQ